MAIESRGKNDIVNPYFDLTGFYARLDFDSIDFPKQISFFRFTVNLFEFEIEEKIR